MWIIRNFLRCWKREHCNSLCVLFICQQVFPNTPEGRVIKNQITKCGTSVGANYREANRARSRADFKNRIKICESEASETQYWLEVIIEVGWLSKEKVEVDYQECSELLAIFAAIGKK